jgi:hypothetical protein
VDKRRVVALSCEVAREAGILILVFASLDAAFGMARVSIFNLTSWNFAGAIMLIAGICVDPEARRK